MPVFTIQSRCFCPMRRSGSPAGTRRAARYESHMEIYKPAYLFNSSGGLATRPTITSAPSAISWNGSFTVSTPDAANISSVVLVRPGAPTHAFDMEQRLVGMSFTIGSGTLTVTAPPNGNIAPPGYYMLFLVNSERSAVGREIYEAEFFRGQPGADGELDLSHLRDARPAERQ